MKPFLQFSNSHIKSEMPTNFVWDVLNEKEEIFDHYDVIELRQFLNFFYPGICLSRRHMNQLLFCLLKMDLQTQLTYHFDGVTTYKMAERLFGQSISVHSIRDSKGAKGWLWKAWADYYPQPKVKIHTDIAWDFVNGVDLKKYSPVAIRGNVLNIFRGIEFTMDLVKQVGEWCDDNNNRILSRYKKQSAIDLTNGRIAVPIKNF